MNGKVKKDFLWGTASAAYQCEGGWNEGGKGESNWDQFCHCLLYTSQYGNSEKRHAFPDRYHSVRFRLSGNQR